MENTEIFIRKQGVNSTDLSTKVNQSNSGGKMRPKHGSTVEDMSRKNQDSSGEQ